MCAISLCAGRIGLGWARDVLTLHVTCSCIFHSFVCLFVCLFTYSSYCELFWDFSDCLFFSLPLLLVTLVMFMAPKRKSTPTRNPLHSGASSSSDHAILSLVSVMMMPIRHLQKTFPNEAFIRNAESSWVILLSPTFPLSFIVGNGSLFVTSPSLVLLCWFRSSTLTCTGLTASYLISLLMFEVFLFLSHRNLLQMCLVFLG